MESMRRERKHAGGEGKQAKVHGLSYGRFLSKRERIPSALLEGPHHAHIHTYIYMYKDIYVCVCMYIVYYIYMYFYVCT